MTVRLKPKVRKVCACGAVFYTAHLHKIQCTRRCKTACSLKDRVNHYKSNYNITIEEYNSLFEEQNGCCAICLKHQSKFKKRLHVDHNHKTGNIRGLLCHGCNLAIGRLNDNPETIKRAAEYVS